MVITVLKYTCGMFVAMILVVWYSYCIFVVVITCNYIMYSESSSSELMFIVVYI